ncbi:diguanylate cyclase (GGDEF) domain protein [compost metagenome]
MTLRSRLLILAVPLSLAVLLIIYLLSNSILLARFDSDDEQRLICQADMLALQVDNFVGRSVDVLRGTALSDDALAFVQGRNTEQFLRRNLDADTVRHEDYNFFLLFDAEGNVLGEQWVPVGNDTLPTSLTSQTHMRPRIIETLRSLGLLNPAGSSAESFAQMVQLDGIPTVILSSPVSDNTGKAAPVGTAVAGRFIGPERLHHQQRFIDGEIQPKIPTTEDGPWHALPSDRHLSRLHPQMGERRLTGTDTQSIDLLFRDSKERPALIMRITQPRSIYAQGRQAIHFFLLLAGAAAGSAIVLMALGLDRWVLRRIEDLHRDIERIGAAGGPARITLGGSDELGLLGQNLNTMIDRLAQSEARDSMVLETICDGFLEMDMQGRILKTNAALDAMLGCRRAEPIGRNVSELLATDRDRDNLRNELQLLPERTTSSLVTLFLRPNGRNRACESHLSIIRDSSGQVQGCRGILRDVSDQLAYQNRLIAQATRDPLTGLGNRQAFHDALCKLEDEGSGIRSAALMFIDLDHFKQVNDTLGHDIGDRLLAAASDRIRRSLRANDQCFRLGGDEFTVIAQNVDQERARDICERLVATLGDSYQLDGQLVDFISASVGVALYPADSDDLEALLKAADSAMYQAKRVRNGYCLCNAGKPGEIRESISSSSAPA